MRVRIAIVVGLVACHGGAASRDLPPDAAAWIAAEHAPVLPGDLVFGMSMDQAEEVLPDLDFHRRRHSVVGGVGDDQVSVAFDTHGLCEVSVLVPPSELADLEHAWGPARTIDDLMGRRLLWVNRKDHVRALTSPDRTMRGKNVVRVTVERYIPLDELLGRTDGRLSIETDLPFLGSSEKALARVYPDLDPTYLQITIPPTEWDLHPIEVDLVPQFGNVDEVTFRLWYGQDDELRQRIRDLVRRDYGTATQVHDGGFEVEVYATPQR